MLWPGWFWRRTGVDARARPARLVQAIVVMLIGTTLIASVPMAILRGLDRNRTGWGAIDPSAYLQSLTVDAMLRDLASGLLMPWNAVDTGWLVSPFSPLYGTLIDDTPILFGFAIPTSTMWLMLMGVLPWTRRRARLRANHVVRAWLGALLPITAAIALWRVVVTAEIVLTQDVGTWSMLLMLTVWGWVLLWWACALWSGWHVRSPLLHLTGAVAAVLGGVALTALIVGVIEGVF